MSRCAKQQSGVRLGSSQRSSLSTPQRLSAPYVPSTSSSQPLSFCPRPMQHYATRPHLSTSPALLHASSQSPPWTHSGPTDAHCRLVSGSKLRATCQLLSTDPLCGLSLPPYPALLSAHMIEISCGAASSKFQRLAITTERAQAARRPIWRPLLLFIWHLTAAAR